MKDDYPLLEQLIGAYLNQDYDLITGSDDIEDVIDYYVARTPGEYLCQLVKEMGQFEAEYANDLDAQYEQIFSPDIMIDSVQDFFELVKSKIQKHLGQST